jgi:NADP-dependent alcohol dehydrogenase
MINFEAYNPTRIVFGKGQYHRIGELMKTLPNVKTVLMVYGGGSIHSNGVYQNVVESLRDFKVIEFSGVEANPEFETLMGAVEIVKLQKVDFILAVGGGSVIDGCKFISGAANYEGDPWDVLLRKEDCVFKSAVPFGAVLTLPATGSEANSGAVISRSSLNLKMTMGGPLFFPVFSICDPTVVATLPKRQIANGIVDAFMHTLEQYITFPTDNLLQERQAEAILSTLMEIGLSVLEDPANYKLAANLMWCATHALNGNLRLGVPTDWSTHMIGHELTAFYGIDHARTLAIIAPRLYTNQFESKKEKLAQFGQRVLNLNGDIDFIAKESIVQLESFFQSLGIETKISNYTADHDWLAKEIRKRFEERNWLTMGERGAITPTEVEKIVLASIG